MRYTNSRGDSRDYTTSFRGHCQQPRAPLPGNQFRHDARDVRAVHVESALPDLSGTATAPRSAGGHSGRSASIYDVTLLPISELLHWVKSLRGINGTARTIESDANNKLPIKS